VQAVLDDYRTSPLTEKEKALFAFIDKVNHTSNQIKLEDVDEVKRAGWDDEAIYDAINVCCLFNFYNRWIDATGVHDMPASAYQLSGERLKAHGYVTNWKSSGEGSQEK
jgi:alkylhydroperoxidase family enzyme